MIRGLFSRKRNPDEYHRLHREVARLEETIAVLEGIDARKTDDNAEQTAADTGVSRLRASLASQQLASIRQELERLRARAAEMLAEDPRLAQDPPAKGAPSGRKNLPLLVGAIMTFVAGIVIGGIYRLSEPTSASFSRPDPPPPMAQASTPSSVAVSVMPPGSAATSSASPVEGSARPADGVQLYLADWSSGLGGWPATAGWSASDQLLQNDGSDFGDENWIGELWNSHWVEAPYVPEEGLATHAVEAEIRVLGRPSCGSFGFVIRGGYQAGVHLCSEYGRPIVAIRSRTPALLVVAPFNPGNGWHTYRVEAHGALLRLLVDGIVVAEVSDDAFPAAGPIGLWDDHTPLAVRQFRVLAL
jgi:hypothetical protein